MIVSHRTLCAAFVLTFSASACSHSNDDASSAQASPVATVTSAATAAPASTSTPVPVATDGNASVDDKRESVTKNGVESSMGAATERELAEIGLPVYPTVTLPNTFLIRHVDKKSASYRLQATVKDDIKTVGDWYGKKLGSSYKRGQIAVMGGITSFTRKTAGDNDSILLQASTDQNLNIPLTTITYTVTKQR